MIPILTSIFFKMGWFNHLIINPFPEFWRPTLTILGPSNGRKFELVLRRGFLVLKMTPGL